MEDDRAATLRSSMTLLALVVKNHLSVQET